MKQTDITYPTPTQPKQLRLDLTTKCNASCLSCHRFLAEGRVGGMNHALLDQILGDVTQWETPLLEIVPVNYGEFFLREDWYEILTKIASRLPRTHIVIPTNGSLLDESKVVQLSRIPTV